MVRPAWELMTEAFVPPFPLYTSTERDALIIWEDRLQTAMDAWIDERFEDWQSLPLDEPIAFIHPDSIRVRARVEDDHQQSHFLEFDLTEVLS